MSESSKKRQCIFPGCDKEPEDSKSLLCVEHKRQRHQAGKVALGVVAALPVLAAAVFAKGKDDL
ncbi:hypothetical protein [Lacticaseibacillus sharpeae]|uniref:hypothetical protein n=1 Tax=Lacticaseibacillus sharpeae TaxID=1626 RepID=UPI00070495EB|nr:hypothetical protein [Lacticaseibacillus sharpeae]